MLHENRYKNITQKTNYTKKCGELVKKEKARMVYTRNSGENRCTRNRGKFDTQEKHGELVIQEIAWRTR